MEIKKGHKGNEVVDIQQRLVALGYDLGPTLMDGYFGRNTERAVKKFQADKNLAVTGAVDDATWRRIVDSTYKLGSRALYLRSPFFHGDDVRQLQQWLNSIGFRTKPVDGIFGPSTEKAVREFQENMALIGDGIVGPSTLAALHNLRSILDKEHADLSHMPPSDSVVSLFQDLKVAVGCLTPHKQDWLAPSGNQQLLCADLSHRLSNLLEILGAQVNFFRLQPKPWIDGEIAIVFRPGADRLPADCLGVLSDPGHRDSKELADLVGVELERSLKDEIKEIVIGDGPGFGRPAVTISPGAIQALRAGENLYRDVCKQKIAGAILDGLKKFISLRNPS